jgi:uncharacterized membrane protein (UPF0127 family)
VHTAGVRVRLDVVFCDRSGRVIAIVADLRPWRLAWCRGTAGRAGLAWEAAAGTLAPYVHPGDVLALVSAAAAHRTINVSEQHSSAPATEATGGKQR